jgi:hypothetical protein
MSFVPDDFAVPRGLVAASFRLEPLGPEHNEGDCRAWMSSVEHIRATPGWAGRSWPRADMTLAENLGDLRVGHLRGPAGSMIMMAMVRGRRR